MNIPDFPKIDAHTHLFYDRSFLVPLLESWNMKAVVINITGKHMFAESMEDRWQAMVRLKNRHPEWFVLCTTFDATGIDEPGFADRIIAGLRQDLQEGASMVKVWKDIGLDIKDTSGQFIQIDDTRFRPIWDFLSHKGVPMLAHIAEPRAAWRPLDPKSPHYTYYSAFPEYHLYLHPEMPSWEHLIAARDRWLEENPDLVVVGAHLGSTEHDVDEVARRLDRYPNFYVDTAERFGDLLTQPHDKVRAFFMKYHDRILYGTDVIYEHPDTATSAEQQQREAAGYEELLRTHWDYLSSDHTIRIADKLVEPILVEGLNLPDEVLHNVYYDNARRLLHL